MFCTNDGPVLSVISSILTSGRTGRLFKHLVQDQAVAANVNSGYQTSKYPTLFRLSGAPRNPKTLEDLEKALLAEIDKLKKEPVPDDELQKVRNQIDANFSRGLENNAGLAAQLGTGAVVLGDWHQIIKLNDKRRVVTAADIQRVAQKYFTSDNLTVAYLIGQGGNGGGGRRGGNGREWRSNVKNKKAFIYPIIDSILLSICSVAALPQTKSTDAKKKSLGESIIEKLPTPPLKWTPPEVGKDVERHVLSNGITVYLKEDHTIPLINVAGRFRGGALYESSTQDSVARLTATVMRTGGTTNTPYQKIDESLDYISANITAMTDEEASSITLNVPSKDVSEALKIYSDIIIHPAFPQDRLDFEKEQIKQTLIRQNDNPTGIATREYRRLVYGEHPYGRAEDWQRIKSVKRDDLVAWHDKYYVPNNAWFGITGDFNTKEMIAMLEKAFAGWEKKPLTLPTPPKVEATTKPAIYIVNRPLNQTAINFGHIGVDRNNPDIYAIIIMNYMLGGGGFASHYTQEVRDKAGLAYTVNSSFDTNSLQPGLFTSVVQTKTETTFQAMSLMLKLINQMRNDPISDEEFLGAKQSIMSGYVRSFGSLAGTVGLLMNLEVQGRDQTYYKNYLANINKVTRADVERVAKKYLQPDKLVFVVVGKSDQFAELLKGIGEIQMLELKPFAE